MDVLKLTEYIPIITTCFSTYFTVVIYKHYLLRKKRYLLWWTIGVVTFGLGTLSESINILAGWSAYNVKFWYIVGALLGGFPLAQGSVHLLLNKKFAQITSYCFSTLIIIASVCVLLSPITIPSDFTYKLTGKVLTWQWVRLFSPLINSYALIFLVGGAFYSAIRYYKLGEKQARFKGNILIAIGGLLPGFGGIATRFGYVELLFVTELVGLLLIYIGYNIIKKDKHQKV